MIRRTSRVLGLLSVVILVSSGAGAQQGAPTNGEWPTYGGDLGGTKYSPLDQIDATNFGDLEIAWRWQSADAFMSKTTASYSPLDQMATSRLPGAGSRPTRS